MIRAQTRCLLITGLFLIPLLTGYAADSHARGLYPQDIEQVVREKYGSKYRISKIDVISNHTGEGSEGGYSVWVSVEGCTGNLMLGYDSTGRETSNYSKLNCG